MFMHSYKYLIFLNLKTEIIKQSFHMAHLSKSPDAEKLICLDILV